MTEGPIGRQILAFSIPLIVGNLFQQLYNTADTLVIGNFLGGDALAAVGAGAVTIHLMISLMAGLATGAGVMVAQYFGAGDRGGLSRVVHTAAAFTLVGGVVLTVCGVSFCVAILRWIRTPADVLPDARVYLQLYFAGTLPLLIYNMGAGILRAVGDSRTPLYYLAFAMVLNVVLDILFVALFGLGVEGVAIATLIAQIAAAWLVVRRMRRADDLYRLDFGSVRIEWDILRRMLRIGVPAGLQQTLMALSNLVVQSCINGLGVVVMAAWNVYGKIDGIAILPIISFSLAIMTFTGQNVGAKLTERVYAGARMGLVISCAFAVLISLLLYLGGGSLLALFTPDPEILAYGRRMIFGLMPFYFLVAIMYALSGVINGAGYSLPTMMIMLVCLCAVRIAYLKIVGLWLDDVGLVFQAYIASWFLCCVGLALYYRKGAWRRALHT